MITESPYVICKKNGAMHQIDCDYVIGCDGFHGISRQTIPDAVCSEFEKVYPFGWLFVLSQTPPVSHELIYSNHEHGFALCSMRKENLSRHYIQTPLIDQVDDWSDARFWDELKKQILETAADTLITRDPLERSIALLDSFICELMRWRRLFLVYDAAHIAPPTGPKGLNLAVSDIHYLSELFIVFYAREDHEGLERYSKIALARVWKGSQFSWWITTTLHRFPDQGDFTQRMQEAEIAYLEMSSAAQTTLAEIMLVCGSNPAHVIGVCGETAAGSVLSSIIVDVFEACARTSAASKSFVLVTTSPLQP
jgi:p-hydroxybenzoate 3-monooxygenase